MKHCLITMLCCCTSLQLSAQKVRFVQKNKQQIDVVINKQLFTSFLYPDTLEKPILYPVIAGNGITVTRGFPLAPRNGDRTDHPHHTGIWFNYESVNGLDFWNNSYNIPAANKVRYGWIRNTQVKQLQENNNKGLLTYTANWENQAGHCLLEEKTSLVFSVADSSRIIDRITTLTARKDTVLFKDVKDGMLGIRIATVLEMPSDKVAEFIDSSGNHVKRSALGNGATGNYLTSAGKTGNDAWGTRGNWCLLSATAQQQPLSVAIIDHPANLGYPTYWHARDYGLFAANPLGQQVFSNGKEQLQFRLLPGQSVTFRYRILITSGKTITAQALEAQAQQFAHWQQP